jgi:hypothetical protein
MKKLLTLVLLFASVSFSQTIDPVTNFGKAQVSGGYNDAVTQITVVSGYGSRFPSPSTDGQFNLVWWDSKTYGDPSDDPNREIVRVSDRTGDVLTIERGVEGTTPKNHNTPGRSWSVVLSWTKAQVDSVRAGINSKQALSDTLTWDATKKNLADSAAAIRSIIIGGTSVDQPARDSIGVHRTALNNVGFQHSGTSTKLLNSTDTVLIGNNFATYGEFRGSNPTVGVENMGAEIQAKSGLALTPNVSGFSSINMYYDAATVGGALMNYLGKSVDGKYKFQWYWGAVDVVQNRVGADSLRPLFIPWGRYESSSSAQDLSAVVMEKFTSGSGITHWPGKVSFNAVPPLAGVVTIATPNIVGDPFVSTYPVLQLHRFLDDSTNTWLSFTHGASALPFFDMASDGTMQWYDATGSLAPDAGIGYKFGFSSNSNHLDIHGGSFTLYSPVTQFSTVNASNNFSIGTNGSDQPVYVTLKPTGTAVSSVLSQTNALTVGTTDSSVLNLATQNTTRMSVNADGGVNVVSTITADSNRTRALSASQFRVYPVNAGLSNENTTASGGEIKITPSAISVATGTNKWKRAILKTWTNPKEIAGIQLWLDAQHAQQVDHSQATNGTNVYYWPDSSGLGNNFEQYNWPPMFISAGPNDYPTVRFNPALYEAMIKSSGTLSDTAFTAFAVVKTSGNNNLISGNGTWDGLFIGTGGENKLSTFDGYTEVKSQVLQIPQATYSLVEWRRSSNVVYFYQNGVEAGYGATANVSFVFSVLGFDPMTSEWFNGDISEVILYNKSLSDADRKAVEQYLNDKYALSAAIYGELAVIGEVNSDLVVGGVLGHGSYTTAEMNAIVAPQDGWTIYNNDSLALYYYGSGSWRKAGSGGGGADSTGEANDGLNMGSGLPMYLGKSGVHLLFPNFNASDFDSSSNTISIDKVNSGLALGTTTMTVAANAPLTSSAGAQDLSANRTWTISADTGAGKLATKTNVSNIDSSLAVGGNMGISRTGKAITVWADTATGKLATKTNVSNIDSALAMDNTLTRTTATKTITLHADTSAGKLATKTNVSNIDTTVTTGWGLARTTVTKTVTFRADTAANMLVTGTMLSNKDSALAINNTMTKSIATRTITLGVDTTNVIGTKTNLATKAATALTLTAGDGLAGGGDLSSNRSFAVNVASAGGVQISSDSLAAKIKGGTLGVDASGLYADTSAGRLATKTDTLRLHNTFTQRIADTSSVLRSLAGTKADTSSQVSLDTTGAAVNGIGKKITYDYTSKTLIIRNDSLGAGAATTSVDSLRHKFVDTTGAGNGIGKKLTFNGTSFIIRNDSTGSAGTPYDSASVAAVADSIRGKALMKFDTTGRSATKKYLTLNATKDTIQLATGGTSSGTLVQDTLGIYAASDSAALRIENSGAGGYLAIGPRNNPVLQIIDDGTTIFSGNVTASTFEGSGANLTGVNAASTDSLRHRYVDTTGAGNGIGKKLTFNGTAFIIRNDSTGGGVGTDTATAVDNTLTRTTAGNVITLHADTTNYLSTHYWSKNGNILLNNIGSQSAAASFNLGTFGITFTVANAISPGIDINGTGNFSSDLLHIHQHTGNPTAGAELLHLEASDADVVPFWLSGANDTSMVVTGTGTAFIDTIKANKMTVAALSGTVRATAGVLSATASDTVGLAAALAGKWAKTDTTAGLLATKTDVTNKDTASAVDNTMKRTTATRTVTFGVDTAAGKIATKTDVAAKANSATTITIAGTANQIISSAGAQDLSTNRTWTLSTALGPVDTSGKTSGSYLRWDGAKWVDSTGGGGAFTAVAAGYAAQSDSIRLVPGTNVTITQSGHAITVNSTATILTNADSIRHVYVDTTGFASDTLQALGHDASKWKMRSLSYLDTTGAAVNGIGKKLTYDFTTKKIIIRNDSLGFGSSARVLMSSGMLDSVKTSDTLFLGWVYPAATIDTIIYSAARSANYTVKLELCDSLYQVAGHSTIDTTGSTVMRFKRSTAVGGGSFTLTVAKLVRAVFTAVATMPKQLNITILGH